MNYKNPY